MAFFTRLPLPAYHKMDHTVDLKECYIPFQEVTFYIRAVSMEVFFRLFNEPFRKSETATLELMSSQD